DFHCTFRIKFRFCWIHVYHPPLIFNTSPVILLASVDDRYLTAAATSLVSIKRPCGKSSKRQAISSLDNFKVILPRPTPGATAFTVTFERANSLAKDLTKVSWAPLKVL